MTTRFLVPVDGTEQSWHAVDIARHLATRHTSDVEVLHVAPSFGDLAAIARRFEDEVARRYGTDAGIASTIIELETTVADAIVACAGDTHAVLLVMTSHGRNRRASVAGSVMEDVLHLRAQPILVVGPRARLVDASDPVLMTTDGSDLADAALTVTASWMSDFGVGAWVAEVLGSAEPIPEAGTERDVAGQRAARLQTLTPRPVRHCTLRDGQPAKAVADFALTSGFSLIVCATRGRSGVGRLLVGSTAAEIIHRAPCPVLLVRPPHLQDGDTVRADGE